ncbi:methylenetetrahydrofolate--tRNA-(uracil(54)-C(5))-methyltransferase (FADH(2)-oxidizing) TrmFO [Clostridiales bacterium FE2011]|nr:methylenetetrahydrofolate--tRNA-(uracil(54)-C(5))-methyltransferase (FADH(2)-oxidizing) TrmFO [Clostridiales bacterium FE2011]QTE75204.1 methylenetetrahydrofolate--tRNA-(uracil(54)-C(5))-methyltransferase (FADH(2)-oxidizing) TrmFO [Clostridiales bacterium FE2010]
MSDRSATVIGAGLAGCEAAWQLAERGIHVRLIEMKPHKMSPAHHSEQFAELVCSNSFRGDRLTNAIGLLKEEMRILGSLIMRCADETKVPAGGALAVDRDSFSAHVTKAITGHPLIEQIHEEAVSIPDGPVIIATGPLTSDAFAEVIRNLPGMNTLNFYDAAAPIVFRESLDESKLFRLSRYNRGNDYLNAPMTEEEYTVFINELINAETAEIHGFEENRVFEGCMPIESMAKRGFMVPAFGPLKPVGLADPRTGKEPFAVVQLRQDNASDTMYNLVGFQTRLKFGEQKRVFGLIPGLEHAEYARYGVMHRNTFLNSPGFLNASFEMISRKQCFFAGQITGVEGYVESAGSGLVAGMTLAAELNETDIPVFPSCTALGAMGKHVSTPNPNFQPMNCSFGLIDPLPVIPGEKRLKKKQDRYEAVAQRALSCIKSIQSQTGGK